MHEFLHIIEHALEDTLKMSWVLFLSYIIIEIIEQKVARKMHKKLKSPYAVAVGAGFGIVPQCGFSVLASDLYSKKQITAGTLLAVFVATSDEAFPILFSSIGQKGVALKLVLLIVSKLILALILGYAVDLIFSRKHNKLNKMQAVDEHNNIHKHDSEDDHEHEHEGHEHEHEHEHDHDHEQHSHDIHEDEDSQDIDIHKGCCGHQIEGKKNSTIKIYVVHPLLHTLKILAYILIINIIMGLILHYVGEDKIAEFMSKTGVLQPILVTMVGLIPNCASSVLITQLFLADTISFGSALGGLIVNAGLGIAYLIKANKNIKQNCAIIFGLFAFALVIAIILHFAVNL